MAMGPTPRESTLNKARQRRATTAIPVPEIQQYGVFTPGYSGYLQAAASDRGPGSSSAERFGNIAALKYNSDAEQQAYANMLKRAQDLQIDAQKRDIRAENQGDIRSDQLDYIKYGIGGAAREETDPITGESSIVYDQDKVNFGNTLGANQQISDYYGKNAETIGKMIESGYGPSNENIGNFFNNPVTGAPLEVGPRAKPSDEVAAANVETAAQKLQRELLVEQVKAEASQNEVQVKAVLNETGDQILYEVTGKNAAAVEKAKQDFRNGGVAVKGDAPPATASPKADAQGGGASATPAAEVRGDLSDYRDVGYDAIENRMERKYNLPPGLMKRIRVFGERSNANQESKKGARTVYQFTPGTRDHFIKRWKIDPWSSPQAAAESAAIHLSDSIQRGQDPVLEYNAGPRSRGAWGSKEARDYKARVDGPEALASVRAQPGNDDVRIAKWKSIPQVADAQRQEDGSVLVTLKNGKTVRYVNGRRQG